jgi:hypothetical protein
MDLPQVRARLVLHRKAAGHDVIAGLQTDNGPGEAVGLSHVNAAAHETSKLAAADLYFVSPEMAELALEASRSLPLFRADPQDFPSEIGLLFFNGGMQIPWNDDFCSVHAISWQAGLSSAHYAVYIDVRSALDALGGESAKNALAHLRAMGASTNDIWFLDINRGLLGFHTDSENGEQQELDALSGHPLGTSAYLLLRSALLMMQQPFAAITDATYDRAARRRLEKLGQEPPRVRVITLRRPKSSNDHGDSDREYHHQWIVRGHWRQQYYPSRGVHRPVWIAPHVKGPEGAPMLGGEKVHAWVR